MQTTGYRIGIETAMSPTEAEAAIREALAAEGFGILSEIDVAATLRAKLDLERPPYKILGACNPVLASKALAADEHIGLLLPCNVIVYETDNGSNIEVLEPQVMSQLVEAEEIAPILAEARTHLVRALEAVAPG